MHDAALDRLLRHPELTLPEIQAALARRLRLLHLKDRVGGFVGGLANHPDLASCLCDPDARRVLSDKLAAYLAEQPWVDVGRVSTDKPLTQIDLVAERIEPLQRHRV